MNGAIGAWAKSATKSVAKEAAKGAGKGAAKGAAVGAVRGTGTGLRKEAGRVAPIPPAVPPALGGEPAGPAAPPAPRARKTSRKPREPRKTATQIRAETRAEAIRAANEAEKAYPLSRAGCCRCCYCYPSEACYTQHVRYEVATPGCCADRQEVHTATRWNMCRCAFPCGCAPPCGTPWGASACCGDPGCCTIERRPGPLRCGWEAETCGFACRNRVWHFPCCANCIDTCQDCSCCCCGWGDCGSAAEFEAGRRRAGAPAAGAKGGPAAGFEDYSYSELEHTSGSASGERGPGSFSSAL